MKQQRNRKDDQLMTRDGWTFVDEAGHERRRQRNRLNEHVPDLDVMTHEQLATFVASARLVPTLQWAWNLFPSRPLHFVRVATGLLHLAHLRLRRLNGAEYEKRYRQLPGWAQWRRRFNILACVIPGERFRKVPPRRPRVGQNLCR